MASGQWNLVALNLKPYILGFLGAYQASQPLGTWEFLQISVYVDDIVEFCIFCRHSQQARRTDCKMRSPVVILHDSKERRAMFYRGLSAHCQRKKAVYVCVHLSVYLFVSVYTIVSKIIIMSIIITTIVILTIIITIT